MPFPFPGETVAPQTFGATPEVPTDSATVTQPLVAQLVVSDDQVFECETGPRAQTATTPKQAVAGLAGLLDPALVGDQGDKLPHAVGVFCGLTALRYGCQDSDGSGQRHIKYPAEQKDAALTTVKVFRASPRAQAVMPTETEALLPIMGKLTVLRVVLARVDTFRDSLDRRIVSLENHAEDILKRAWSVLRPLGEAYPGSVGNSLGPIGAYFTIDAEKAKKTIQNKEEARAEGRQEERDAQAAKAAPAAASPATSVLINQPAPTPAAVIGGTPPAPPARRAAPRGV